jgi:hypothetical protein
MDWRMNRNGNEIGRAFVSERRMEGEATRDVWD